MKSKLKIVTVAEIAAFASIAFVLDFLATLYSGFFASGGSISLAMIPVIILSFRRGPVAGMICGFIVGLLDLTDGFYTITDKWYNSIIQIGFDYIFTYMLVGFVGVIKPLFKKMNKVLLATLLTFIAGVGKYMLHFLSGVMFWPQFPNQPLSQRIGYSIVYNGLYMVPTIILSIIVMLVISIGFKQIFIDKD